MSTTLLQDVYTFLMGLNPAGGVWPMVNQNQPLVFPYITYMRIVNTDNVSMDGMSDLQGTLIQFDFFSDTMAGLDALVRQFNSALDTWAVKNVPISAADLYEPEIKAYRTRRDVNLWATN